MSAEQASKKIKAFLEIVLVSCILSGMLAYTKILGEVESRSWDWRLGFLARFVEPSPQIQIITIDQRSIEFMADQQSIYWPWPRALYVPIIQYLKLAKAKGIAFDVLFTERSHYDVHDDEDFAATFSPDLPVVIAAASRSRAKPVESATLQRFRTRQTELDASTRFVDRYGLENLTEAGVWTLPIPQLLNRAAAVADVNLRNDSDGIFRHARAGSIIQGTPVLTLPFALHEVVAPNAPAKIDSSKSGSLAVRFAGPSHTYKTHSFASIVESFTRISEGKDPLVPLNQFRDAYVFIGMDAPGLQDLRPTPLAPNFPGVEFHATVLDNILSGTFIRSAPMLITVLIAMIAAALGAAGVLFNTRPKTQFLYGALTIALVVLTCYMGAILGWWIQMIIPLVVTVIAITLAASSQYQIEGSQVRFIKRAFRFYVSPEIIDRIIAEPDQLTLGGEKRELSIFFCDIAGFTGISEKMDAARLGQFLNLFLSEMTSIILAHEGTVDKYVGDAIVAFWNAPLFLPDHASRAVRTAVACQDRLTELRDGFASEFGQVVHLRIGIHTGSVSVGNFGSNERFNYTVIGDAANLASRLEGANKAFGTDILVSGSTVAQLGPAVPCVKVATIAVIGRSEPLEVYTPSSRLGDEAELIGSAVDAFFQRDLDRSLELWKTVTNAVRLRDTYIARISGEKTDFMASSENWSPVWKLQEK